MPGRSTISICRQLSPRCEAKRTRFNAGAELADHQANGLVTIHCLDGALNVRTAEHTYELAPNGLVVLAPCVRHSVRASGDAPSAMLLSVCRESDAPAAEEK